MSSHTRRPRSGNIDMQKLKAAEEQRQQHFGDDLEQEAQGLPSPPATATTPVSPRRSPAALIIDSSGAGSGSSSGNWLSIIRSRTSTEPAAAAAERQQQNCHHRSRVVSRSLPAAEWRDAQQYWECEQQQLGRHADLGWDQQDTSAAIVLRTRGSSSSSSSSSSREGAGVKKNILSGGGGGGGGGGANPSRLPGVFSKRAASYSKLAWQAWSATTTTRG
ncbi:unnamed protein product [Ectocarpus sp. 4 AP-2014]